MLKMYIAVLDEVPDSMVPVLVAHSVLRAHLLHDSPLYQEWLHCSFRKVVVRVNRAEFFKIKELPDVCEGYENTVLDAEASCIVVMPREEWPNVIKFAKLWKPKESQADIEHTRLMQSFMPTFGMADSEARAHQGIYG